MPAAEDTTSARPIFEGYLSKNELAAQLGMSPRTIDRWELFGLAPASTRVGRTVLYRRDAVLEWLRSKERTHIRASRKKGGA